MTNPNYCAISSGDILICHATCLLEGDNIGRREEEKDVLTEMLVFNHLLIYFIKHPLEAISVTTRSNKHIQARVLCFRDISSHFHQHCDLSEVLRLSQFITLAHTCSVCKTVLTKVPDVVQVQKNSLGPVL